jgi:hypothetical protein
MMRAKLWVVVVAFGFVAGSAVSDTLAQSHAKVSPKKASICGNPLEACKTTATFHPNDLPFRVLKDAVIIDTVPFYAIILRSVVGSPDRCDDFIPETDRLAAQALFPDHKVFSSRCTDPENSRYEDVTTRKITNLSDTHRIMAVYAGASLAEAKQFLEKVKATGKFPGANLRRLRTGFNGT